MYGFSKSYFIANMCEYCELLTSTPGVGDHYWQSFFLFAGAHREHSIVLPLLQTYYTHLILMTRNGQVTRGAFVMK